MSKRRSLIALVAATLLAATAPSHCLIAQAPQGLAANAIANTAFTWVQRTTPGFRVYFHADTYPARHQDSLLTLLPSALEHARTMIGTNAPTGPIDVFFVESRDAMTQLIGGRATGFAHQAARAVFLMTNPSWRAFDRHEIMHIVAWHAWGPPGANSDWLQEGIAQAADGRCSAYSNESVLRGLVRRDGWVSLDDLLLRFRQQPDLRAYLQAAAFTRYLFDTFGPQVVERLWRSGSHADTPIGDRPFAVVEQQWRTIVSRGDVPAPAALARIDADGCGVK